MGNVHVFQRYVKYVFDFAFTYALSKERKVCKERKMYNTFMQFMKENNPRSAYLCSPLIRKIQIQIKVSTMCVLYYLLWSCVLQTNGDNTMEWNNAGNYYTTNIINRQLYLLHLFIPPSKLLSILLFFQFLYMFFFLSADLSVS